MPRKKGKFIDKKKAVSFRLVHRSQRDPLAADSDAPQHVLQPLDGRFESLVYSDMVEMFLLKLTSF